MYKVIVLTLALAVAGCANRPTIAEECSKLGVGPGKPGYADCYLRLRQVDATLYAGIMASP